MKQFYLLVTLFFAGFLSASAQDTSCYVLVQQILGTTMVQATAYPAGNYTFVWSDGSTGSTANMNALGNPCVTATNADGSCSATGCYTPNSCALTIVSGGDSILFVTATGVAPFTYTWSDGSNWSSLNVMEAGTYCVTVTDATGCTAAGCYMVSNVPECSAYIMASPAGGLSASITGDATSFLWSTGETTSEIQPSSAGMYCVTATNAAGCEANYCYFYSDSTNNLSAYIIEQDGVLTCVVNGGNGVTFSWSNGANTAAIVPNGSGTYCCTVVTADGQTFTTCYNYVAGGSNLAIGGLVSTIDNSALYGIVYLIKYSADAGTLTAVDSTEIMSYDSMGIFYNLYEFNGVEAGDYLVKATLAPGTSAYPNHLPTYYGNVLYWDEATTITPGDFVPNIANITLVSGINPGGPGFVGGLVSEGANIVGGGHNGDAEGSGPGDPVENATVILQTTSGTNIAHTKTDASGHYQFSNIPYGEFVICVDHLAASHGCANALVTQSGSSNVDFVMEAGSIVSSVNDQMAFGKATLVPNPSADATMLAFDAKESGYIVVRVTDAQGRMMWSTGTDISSGAQQVRIPTENMPQGVYTVQALNGDRQISLRFVKI